MLIVKNLSKSYPPNQQVLTSIDCNAEKGEFIAIIGASGSGKSTLLRCLSFKEKWSGGKLIYNEKRYNHSSLIDRYRLSNEFALLEEKPFFYQNKSAIKNVLKGRFIQNPIKRFITSSLSRNEHVLGMDYLENVGLLDKGHLKIKDLSGGEKQRVAIARALIQGAHVLFADEPVTGLDPKSLEIVMNDLRALARYQGMTVICVLNQLDLAVRYASRIWGIVDGTIQLDISARALTTQENNLIFPYDSRVANPI
jgi:phosphonate transport system ATP-binding protein